MRVFRAAFGGECRAIENEKAIAALVNYGLDVPLTLLADTVSNPVPLCGRLPEDRARMLAELDAALAAADEATLSEYRRSIVHL